MLLMLASVTGDMILPCFVYVASRMVFLMFVLASALIRIFERSSMEF